MGIIARRRRSFQQYLNELETFLTKNGVTPCHMFKDTNLLNYLVCSPFNNLLHSMKVTTVNIDLTEEEKRFVDFILTYRKIRRKKQNFLLDTPSDVQYHDSPIMGRRENPRYEEEMTQYRLKLEEYEYKKEMMEKKREELWRGPEADIYRYVEKEERSAVCSQCLGTGWKRPEEPRGPEAEEIKCPWCSGTGSSGYTPRVNRDQRQAAETFRTKLEDLDAPVFAGFPLKRKSVYIRLTHEGQLFIKSKDSI